MMTQIIIIDKTGTVKQSIVKDVSRDNLYKKCNYKSSNGFEKRTTWNVNINNEKIMVELWAKDNGRANTENKYDFPPPMDTTLFFGTCAIIRVNKKDEIVNLSCETWNKVYEKLFGGFKDIDNDDEEDDEDEEDEDELDNIPKELKVKDGYLKDGFVVDDEDDEDDENDEEGDEEVEEEEDEEDEDEEDDDEEDNENETNEYSGSELTEEQYNYSDED